MQTQKEYEEQLLWLRSDGCRWLLCFSFGVGYMLPLIFITTFLTCCIFEKIPELEPYTRYNQEDILFACSVISYIFGVLIVRLIHCSEKYINKTINEKKKERQGEIAEIKRIMKEGDEDKAEEENVLS